MLVLLVMSAQMLSQVSGNTSWTQAHASHAEFKASCASTSWSSLICCSHVLNLPIWAHFINSIWIRCTPHVNWLVLRMSTCARDLFSLRITAWVMLY